MSLESGEMKKLSQEDQLFSHADFWRQWVLSFFLVRWRAEPEIRMPPKRGKKGNEFEFWGFEVGRVEREVRRGFWIWTWIWERAQGVIWMWLFLRRVKPVTVSWSPASKRGKSST